MGQVYLHTYRYKGVLKSEVDHAWGAALEAFAKTGNYGNVESGVRPSETGVAFHMTIAFERGFARGF